MRDPRPDDLAGPAVPRRPSALPAQQPALAWLAEPPTRRRSAVLALLALPPAPEADSAPAAGAQAASAGEGAADAPREEEVVPAGALPRRAPARPAPVVPGPRAPVLDRAWAHDQDTLQRIIVGLRAL